MMHTRTNDRRRALRRGERGAVLVEAALVLPFLVVFLGLFTFFHLAYREKIRIRAEARRTAFDAASRGCPAGATGGSESSMSGASAGALARTAGEKGDGTAGAMSFSHGTASASVGATVSWKTAYGPWSKTLRRAQSAVYCNERPISTDAAGWVDWGSRR